MAEGGQPLPLSDHGLMADDAELEAELFGEELPSLETASASGPFPFAKQSSTPAHAENDGAQASERVREEVGAEILFEEPVEQEQLLQTKVKSASGVVGQAKKILNGSEALGKMEKRGDEDVLQATLYGASAGVDAGAEEKRAELNEQMDANKPRETEPMVATTRVEEVPAPDAEDEDELYGALYGDVDDEPLLGGEEASQLTAEETGQVKLRVNETLEPEAFGILPVEEDVAKLAAVVGLTAPEAEEEEDSESEDSDSEDDFEILVNDDQFRPAVGHSAMPPISRVPARAEGDGDEESDSDSDAFTIILDDEGAGPAAGMKRGMEDEPGLQREYSLKPQPSTGATGLKPAAADQALEERPVQDVFQMQNGMQYGGRGGRRWGQQQRGNDVYFPNASHVFDLNLEDLEMKPWRFAGTDVSDFFNFDLNEQTWYAYCQQLAQARLEQTMQSKIRVYESRTANGPEADPDLPPELASALNLDTGGQQPQMGRPNAFQAHRGGPSADLRRFRPRDADAVIEIQVQSDVAPPSAAETAPVTQEEQRPVEPGSKTNVAQEAGSAEDTIGNGLERTDEEAGTGDGGNQTGGGENTVKKEGMDVGERQAEQAVKEEAEESAEGGKEPLENGGKAPEKLGEKPEEVKMEAGEGVAEPSVKQEKSESEESASREQSRSPSRSRSSTPPGKSEDRGGKHDRVREQRGVRELSRDRPLSRGDGRPFPPRPGPMRPPFVPGGPVGAPERPPYWGEEPGFRPPFPPYGPGGPYFDGPYWGMQGGVPPGPNGPFYGPNGGQFFPPGPFEPGMRPPFGPVDGPWGQPFTGMRPGPVLRPLPDRDGGAWGGVTGNARARKKGEETSSDETSSEDSSSESGSRSESGSESDSSSDDSRRKSKRPAERSRAKPGPYLPAPVRFDEFGRPLPGGRIVYDDFGRPIELDPYGRPLDPRRAAEYDEFMRHQFEGRRDGTGRGAGFRGRGPGWFGEGRGPGEIRGRGGRGRDGRLPDEVYAARRRERDERLAHEERARHDRERRLRGEREPSRNLDRERFARDERRKEGFEEGRVRDLWFREDEEERFRGGHHRGVSRGIEEGRGRDGGSRGVSRGLDEERWREDRHRAASRGLEEERLRVRETGGYRDSRARNHEDDREYRPERESHQRGARAERAEFREKNVRETRRERSERRRDASADDGVPSRERSSRREHARDERRRGEQPSVAERERRYSPGSESEEEQGGQVERSRQRDQSERGRNVIIKGQGPDVFSDDEERQAADDVRKEGDGYRGPEADVMEPRDGRQQGRTAELDEDDLLDADRRFRAGEMGAEDGVQLEGEGMEDRRRGLEGELEAREKAGAADGAGEDEEGGGESNKGRRRRRKERRHMHREEKEGDENEEEREERRRRRRERKERDRAALESQGPEAEANHVGFDAELGSPGRQEGLSDEDRGKPSFELQQESEKPDEREANGRSEKGADGKEEDGYGGDQSRREKGTEVDDRQEDRGLGGSGGAAEDEKDERRRRKEERRRRHKERKEGKEQELEKDENGQAVEESERKHRHKRHRHHRGADDKRSGEVTGEKVEGGVQEMDGDERRERKRHRGEEEQGEERIGGVREEYEKREDGPRQKEIHGGEKDGQRGGVSEGGEGISSRQDRGEIGKGPYVKPEGGVEEVNEEGIPGEESAGRRDRKRRRKHRHRNEDEGEEDREARREKRRERKRRKGEEGGAIEVDAEDDETGKAAETRVQEDRKEGDERREREHEESRKSRAREESVPREVSRDSRAVRARDVDTAGARDRDGADVTRSDRRGDVSRERREREPSQERRTGRNEKRNGSGGSPRKEQREGSEKEALSEFEAKLRRRAERFGPMKPIEEEAPRGSTRQDESAELRSVIVKDRLSRRREDRSPPRSEATPERVTGFMDVDRPEEELPYLGGADAREDGSQRKRKRGEARENGMEEGGTKGGRDWNEAKFRITGLGAPVKLTGGGGQNGVAKRKVVGASEGSEASRPQRVVIQDVGAKNPGDVARKRMFQQAMAGVGGLGRSLSNKGGGRNDM